DAQEGLVPARRHVGQRSGFPGAGVPYDSIQESFLAQRDDTVFVAQFDAAAHASMDVRVHAVDFAVDTQRLIVLLALNALRHLVDVCQILQTRDANTFDRADTPIAVQGRIE